MSCDGVTRLGRPAELGPGSAELDAFGDGFATLVTLAGTKPQLTARRSTDAHTALTLGLAQYLAQLYLDLGQHDLRLKKVLAHWAEPEDRAVYPSACVYSLGPGKFRGSFTPQTSPGSQVAGPAPGLYLVGTGELELDLVVEVWTTDPLSRMAVSAMLEDGLNILDWRGGVLLDLPHYFGQRAAYDLVDLAYVDDEPSATAGNWRVMATVNSRVQTSRLRSLPNMRPRPRVEVTGDPL